MTDFPASPATPGQAESRASWRELQASEKKPAWWSDFLLIRDAFPHFRNWRIWVYIAWAGSPAATRTPRTLEELAAGVLGCTSRVVRKWRAADWGDLPGVDDAVAWVQAAPLMQHRRDVYEALITVAKMADPKAHQDRRLFLEMTGDYRPKATAQFNLDVDLASLSDEQLQRIAAGDDPATVLATAGGG